MFLRFLECSLISSLVLFLPNTVFATTELDPLNETIYLETNKEIALFVPYMEENGAPALQSLTTLPAETIISLPISQLAASIHWQKNKPQRVNFPYYNNKGQRKESRNGWICGLRVVDISDSDLRTSAHYDRSDLCLSLSDLKTLTIMQANAKEAQVAMRSYTLNNNIEQLASLHHSVSSWKKSRIYKARNLQMVSPLKNISNLEVTSEFGMRPHPVYKRNMLHKGIDLRARTGEEVASVLPGRILAVRSERSKNGNLKGYGHYVIVVHPEERMETLYAHLSRFKTKMGTPVNAGSVIALSGNTGVGTAPHLHFETKVTKNGTAQNADPRSFIGELVQKITHLIWQLVAIA